MAGSTLDLRVTGADSLAEFARELKSAGSPVQTRREIFRGLNRATKDFRQHLRESALATLPAGGKLNDRVAKASYTTRVRIVAGNPSVRIRIMGKKRAPIDVNAADAGTVRHPTWGRKPTQVQAIKPGWFAEPWAKEADEVRRELLKVIDEAVRKLRNG